MSICLLQGAAMYATTDLRSREDAAFEPQGNGWMYRSEAFAEDVDHLLPATLPLTGRPEAAAAASRLTAPRKPARWPAVLSGALFGRAQRAG
jgi:hypothetical protein